MLSHAGRPWPRRRVPLPEPGGDPRRVQDLLQRADSAWAGACAVTRGGLRLTRLPAPPGYPQVVQHRPRLAGADVDGRGLGADHPLGSVPSPTTYDRPPPPNVPPADGHLLLRLDGALPHPRRRPGREPGPAGQGRPRARLRVEPRRQGVCGGRRSHATARRGAPLRLLHDAPSRMVADPTLTHASRRRAQMFDDKGEPRFEIGQVSRNCVSWNTHGRFFALAVRARVYGPPVCARRAHLRPPLGTGVRQPGWRAGLLGQEQDEEDRSHRGVPSTLWPSRARGGAAAHVWAVALFRPSSPLQSRCAIQWSWSPCGRFFLTATVAPRMNIDNGFKVSRSRAATPSCSRGRALTAPRPDFRLQWRPPARGVH